MIFLIFVVIVVALSLLEALTTQNNKFLMCNDFALKNQQFDWKHATKSTSAGTHAYR